MLSPSQADSIVEDARNEYMEQGTFATDTYMALNNAGFNPDILMAQFEEELHG